MIRDVSRDRLPNGAVWNLQDYIPNSLGAPLTKRGGWSYGSADLGASISRTETLIDANFSSGSELCAVVFNTSSEYRFRSAITTGDDGDDRGVVSEPAQPPVFYRNLVIITRAGSGAPYKYDKGNAVAALGGTPPDGAYCCVYKDHLVLARASASSPSVFFSDAGDPETWDTSNSFINASGVSTGIWPLRNSILVFHHGSLERIIGSIPPPGSDMFLQTMWDRGVENPWSFAGTDEFLVFANREGVYMTDGSTPINLTKQGGISQLWQQTVSSNRIVGGYWRDLYFATLMNGNTFVDCFVCEIPTRRWFRLTNLPVKSFGRSTTGSTLYGALSNDGFLADMSTILAPSSSVKNDADGTAVTPIMETPFYVLGSSKGRIKSSYLKYDLRDAATDNPILTASAVYSPESTSYTSLSPTMGETTQMERERFTLNKAAYGFGLKVAQTNSSSVTKLYELVADAHPREDSRLG